MRLTNPIKFNFGPASSQIPVLKTEIGQIIWGGIKIQHLTCQYFNDNCLMLVQYIEKDPPKDAKRLYAMACNCGLGMFGIIWEGEGYESRAKRPDMEFWGDMFDAITGKLKIEIQVPEKTN
jgi:hypothetical protein